MYRDIIDYYFNIFFIEIQLKKENVKSFFGRQSLVSQMAWIPQWTSTKAQ